jgi:hypothetical protein
MSSFPGAKRPGREVDHSFSSSAEVKNEWSYTSTPSMCFHCVDGGNFAFTPVREGRRLQNNFVITLLPVLPVFCVINKRINCCCWIDVEPGRIFSVSLSRSRYWLLSVLVPLQRRPAVRQWTPGVSWTANYWCCDLPSAPIFRQHTQHV